jgi:hypothetical protein
MSDNCNNVISLKQYGPTCWFNSILMAILYSDNSRKLLLEKSKKWNKKIILFKTINYILHNKYLRSSNVTDDYKYFDKIRPEYLLNKLYKYNKKKFVFNLKKHKGGFKSEMYIRKVYKLLGVNVLYLDIVNDDLYYSLFNNMTNVEIIKSKYVQFKIKYVKEQTIKEKFENPEVIIINYSDSNSNNKYPQHYKVDKDSKLYKNIIKLDDEIVSDNGIKYVQDSIILNNWNKGEKNIGGHSIAGLTCRGNKYVYNGWTRTTLDTNLKKYDTDDKNVWEEVLNKDGKLFYYNNVLNVSEWKPPKKAKIIKLSDKISIPCELMKYNWSISNANDFCLNHKKCSLDKINPKDLCFSFSKGRRCVIYVTKNIKTQEKQKHDISNKLNKSSKVKPEKPIKVCPEGKVLNPLTNRCINIKTINKVRKNPLSKPENPEIKPQNPCPEGKIRNPKTGRCINIKPLKEIKNCPEGKIRNPKTGRCINIKPLK